VLVWAGLICRTVRKVLGFCDYGKEPLGSINVWNFATRWATGISRRNLGSSSRAGR